MHCNPQTDMIVSVSGLQHCHNLIRSDIVALNYHHYELHQNPIILDASHCVQIKESTCDIRGALENFPNEIKLMLGCHDKSVTKYDILVIDR